MCREQLSRFVAALLAGVTGCSVKEPARTTPEGAVPATQTIGTQEKSVTYTLTLWQNNTSIPNPSEADVRAAVAALDDSEIGPRLVIRTSDKKNQIEVSGTPRDGFAFDYYENGSDLLYVSRRTNFSRDAVARLLVGYISGTADWKSLAEWQTLRR